MMKTDHLVGSRLKRREDLSMSRCHSTWHMKVPSAIFSRKKTLEANCECKKTPKILKTDQQVGTRLKKREDLFMSRCHSTWHSDTWRYLAPFLQEKDTGHLRVQEDTKDAEDRPTGRIKTIKGGSPCSWVGVTPRDAATHKSTKRHFFKKDDTGGHSGENEDIKWCWRPTTRSHQD